MPRQNFSHIDTWVFDLDNTLYPPRFRLFDQIEKRMVDWVMGTLGVSKAEADRLRSTYWALHGTTLAGLMAEHNIEPDPFLEHVHDIDFTVLEPDAALAGHIRDLPGRKIVYTNGSAPYAEQVLKARGLSGLFDAVYGIEHANYRPKPEAAAFDAVFKRDNLRPETAAMFEDDQRNLAVPHAIGMRTVHVAPEAHTADHIHHHTVDLTDFLSQIK
ncbi:pyrimidine 5'-nucleotidase [Donghicola sp. C2-DW-16]|uniref:Pyrimidine 5'-nucleotidase n=1 Tax=Donghicola mangrovi TaxID=2729614 RepID=A0ABX2PDU6_9RHOB|nr:pyrimidine 5'-nucleotidase [Donghicola mangrovi]NVO27350.1 pyrimidine 5'-nucleotidase [Donghicola mangrovi]